MITLGQSRSPSASGGPAVLDAIGTRTRQAAGASLSLATITVGVGIHRALVAMIGIAVPTVTGVTATWDVGGSNQAMAEIVRFTGAATQGLDILFGLVNPASGALTLTISWTGVSEANMNAISFTGVNQAGGASSFPNSTSANSAVGSSPASITVTSGVNDLCMAFFQTASGFSAPNQTEIYVDNGMAVHAYEAQRAAGAATVNFTAAVGSGVPWGAVATDVAGG